MKNEIVLRPAYWANVSGGKDSLFMLGVILSNPNKYPLDGAVHFELENDYPFIRNVTDHMEKVCKEYSIPFRRYRPRKNFIELYNKYGYPTRLSRWCNSAYKLDCSKQLERDEKNSGRKVIHYVGICADEIKRQRQIENVVYPLAFLKIKYPELYEFYIKLVIESENKNGKIIFSSNPKYNGKYIDSRIEQKYIPQLIKRYTKYKQGVL